MKRHLMTQLCAWKNKAGRKPLILKGVRQVGKTYLLEEFGRQNFQNYHIINFEKHKQAGDLFNTDLSPKTIINELSFLLKKNIQPHSDLLIFDEIQACPNALTSLKYFCEDMPELALCSAGSLLGLHLNNGSYPVGKVDMLHLYPMTFSEFLQGIGDENSANFLANANKTTKISKPRHEHLWTCLKYYFATGGLPEVISVFHSVQDVPYTALQNIRVKQLELINAYYADVAKHSGKVNAMHIDRTWNAVPKQLAASHDGNSNRFRFKDIIPNIHRYSQLVNVIDWLNAAELIIKLPIIETIRQPLKAFTKENMFKIFMFDVGILGAMMELAPEVLLKYDYGSYKGYFAENFVIQQLQTVYFSGIYNWQEQRSEIEFILPFKDKAIPIEVKSGQITRAQSLKKFREKYHPPTSFILSANNLMLNQNNQTVYLPLYFAEYIHNFIEI